MLENTHYLTFPFFVLIETLWNVNSGYRMQWNEYVSINRNIVECKLVRCAFEKHALYSINRNIVECKFEFLLIPVKVVSPY